MGLKVGTGARPAAPGAGALPIPAVWLDSANQRRHCQVICKFIGWPLVGGGNGLLT